MGELHDIAIGLLSTAIWEGVAKFFTLFKKNYYQIIHRFVVLPEGTRLASFHRVVLPKLFLQVF